MMRKEGERLIKGAGTIQPCIFVPQVIKQRREAARKVGSLSRNFAKQKIPVFHEISCSKHKMVYILNSEIARNAMK